MSFSHSPKRNALPLRNVCRAFFNLPNYSAGILEGFQLRVLFSMLPSNTLRIVFISSPFLFLLKVTFVTYEMRYQFRLNKLIIFGILMGSVNVDRLINTFNLSEWFAGGCFFFCFAQMSMYTNDEIYWNMLRAAQTEDLQFQHFL